MKTLVKYVAKGSVLTLRNTRKPLSMQVSVEKLVAAGLGDNTVENGRVWAVPAQYERVQALTR